MVRRVSEDGLVWHEPPYTDAERYAFYKAIENGPVAFSRPSPPRSPGASPLLRLLLIHHLLQPRHRNQHRRQSHRPGLPSPAQADQPARRVNLASVLDSLIDRRAALRVDSHLLQDPLAHSWVLVEPREHRRRFCLVEVLEQRLGDGAALCPPEIFVAGIDACHLRPCRLRRAWAPAQVHPVVDLVPQLLSLRAVISGIASPR